MNLDCTIYHVTPITPHDMLRAHAGRHFCVSYGYPQQAHLMDEVAAGVMYDNGAFRAHTKGWRTNWPGYYDWLAERLWVPRRWAVIPDVIAEGGQAQDALITQWPFGDRGAPVWHTGEPIARLLALLDRWPRICIGSTDEHWIVGSDVWMARLDEAWEEILRRHGKAVVHMLRGLDVAHLFPFDSADSSSLGQNSHRYASPLFGGFDGSIAYAERLEDMGHPSRTRRHPPRIKIEGIVPDLWQPAPMPLLI